MTGLKTFLIKITIVCFVIGLAISYLDGSGTPSGTWLYRAESAVLESAQVVLLGIVLVGMAGADVRRKRKKRAVGNSDRDLIAHRLRKACKSIDKAC